MMTRITRWASLSGVWIAVYLSLILLPFAILLTGDPAPGGGFHWDFALALGYSGMAMMGVQFWLTARFKRASAPFGIDILYFFHRYLALVAFAAVLLHAGLLIAEGHVSLDRLDPRRMPTFLSLGWVAALGFTTLLASSLWRKPLGLEYDRWRRWHVALAVLSMLAAVLHIWGSGYYLADPAKHLAWSAFTLSWLALVVYVRAIRPWLLSRQAYVVSAVLQQPGNCWSVRLQPPPGQRLNYQPGQFAWLSLRTSPYALREHPFSLSSSPSRGDEIEFTIKALGDFTATVGQITPGELAYVDGPYGRFGIEQHHDVPGLVFIAGGVGIAPIISILRAAADRKDRRPIWLFYGNRRWDRVLFRDELDDLGKSLALHVVHTLIEPPAQWTGEQGFISRDALARHLPENFAALPYFVCGPMPMIHSVEHSLRDLDVPLTQLHSEIFDLA